MLAKVLSGWPRSDRRTRCTATAGCGHSCSRTGPSNTSSRSWWVRIQSLAMRLTRSLSKPCTSHPATPASTSSSSASTMRR